jgi:hypothetical protein
LNTSGLEEDDSIKFSGRDVHDSDSLKTLEVDDSEAKNEVRTPQPLSPLPFE